jgi:hypothetical protein
MEPYKSAKQLDDDFLREILEDNRGSSSQTVTAPGLNEDSIEQGEAAYRTWDRRRRAWIRYRRRRSKAAHMNLLDHQGIVLNRDDVMMIGLGMGISVQGLFLAGILGIIMSALGMMTGVMTIMKKFMPMADPVIDTVETVLQSAYKQGLPIELLEHELGKQLVTHAFSKRVTKYAMLTMLGGGAGSFWLSAACMGVSLFALPNMLHSGFALLSSAALFKHAFEQAADDILSYRFMHHPDVVLERIYEATREYNRRLEKPRPEPEASLALSATLEFLQEHQAELPVQLPPALLEMATTGLSQSSNAMAAAAPARTDSAFVSLPHQEKHSNTETIGAVTALLEKVMAEGVRADQKPPVPPELQLAMERFAHDVAFGRSARQAH